MSLSYADIAVIVIVLIFLIIGYCKGLIKMIFSLSRKLIAFIGTYLLVGPVRNLLLKTSIGESINTTIKEWIATKIDTIHLPEFIQNAVNSMMENNEGLSNVDALSNTLTYYVMTIISFIAVFIVLLLVLFIVQLILDSVMEAPVLKPINKILGSVVGIAIGLVIVSIGMLVLTGLNNWFEWGNNFVTTYIDPTNENFGIARWLYNNNLLQLLLEKLIDFDGAVNLF